jgi:GNAT superfamily N-acetyltransferase
MKPSFRRADLMSEAEMNFIAEMDSRIPLEYDSSYKFSESSIPERREYYEKFTAEDFFEVAVMDGKVVGFHLAHIIPYPGDVFIGNVATLWVDPACRGQGIAGELKARAEAWGREHRLVFLQTNVHRNNQRMLAINESLGFEVSYLNLRKRL